MPAKSAVLLIVAWGLLACPACGGEDPRGDAGAAGAADAGGRAGGSAGERAGSGGAGSSGGPAGDAGELDAGGGSGTTGAQDDAGPSAPDGGADASTEATDGGMSSPASLLPLQSGNRWTFRVTDGAVVTTKTQTIGDLELVGGSGPNADAMAYRVTTEKGDGADETVSWQAAVDDKIVRYREQAFTADGALDLEEHWDPYKLRLDMTEQRLATGASYVERYDETKERSAGPVTTSEESDEWRVIAREERVEVPAGSFRALVLEKVSVNGSVKRYWFVRGVGKVKETGTQSEELLDYELAD